MNKTSVVIIEDEKPAARLLKSMIDKIRPEWNTVIIAGSIKEAVLWFSKNTHPDLIFLDIHLSDGNSFDFLSEVRPSSAIIFTTAYDEYALKAFSVNSIDYILKPIHQERLIESIEKYEHTYGNSIKYNQDYLENLLDIMSNPTSKPYRTRFLICGVEEYITLQTDDIAYFYSENHSVSAVTRQGKELVIDFTLDKIGEQLNPHQFFRANRQFLISINSIRKIEPYFGGKLIVAVIPPSKVPITISREKLTTFKSWLNY
jgi:DNA-binding LytR/AlgR family response regulator